MSSEKKTDNKIQEYKGKVKETVGKTVGNESLEAEGKKDQTAGSLKNAGEKVKDAFRD
ncbi:CsbD family protein [Actinomycetospora lutea]|uniref:CsbD family protein n=1 Tax=Actinomycetospora lutea TaxID=663604 RepID=UPI0023651887|nr:CsbD family protein [Actinomycetospora lutea]MDD7938061.1 CsbD family protein [Actinomycetospora lutea]